MAKRYLLDFEKPLVELEKQIEQIKEQPEILKWMLVNNFYSLRL